MKRNRYKIIYVLLWIVVNSLAFWTSSTCVALEVYDVFSLTDLIVVTTSPLVSYFILLFGRLVYRKLISKMEIQSLIKFKRNSFIIISAISLFYPLSIIASNVWNHSIQTSICSKSNLSPYDPTSVNLTIDEYNYIKNTNFFPDLPNEATEIKITYWEDSFIGEHSLHIYFKLSLHENYKFTKRWKEETWKIIQKDSVEQTMTIMYSDFLD